MTTTRVVIIGAGGFGREVHDILIDAQDQGAMTGQKYELLGFLDDGKPDAGRLERIGASYLGPVSMLAELDKASRYSIGIGAGAVRRRLDEYASSLGLEPVTLIHSSATFGRDVRIGCGAVICAGVRLTTNITLGRHVHLNLNSTVGHDAILGDYVTVNPLAAISGDVTLEDEVTIGTTASVNQGLTVGERSVIGAGGSVAKNIPAGVVAVGVPASPRG